MSHVTSYFKGKIVLVLKRSQTQNRSGIVTDIIGPHRSGYDPHNAHCTPKLHLSLIPGHLVMGSTLTHTDTKTHPHTAHRFMVCKTFKHKALYNLEYTHPADVFTKGGHFTQLTNAQTFTKSRTSHECTWHIK